MEAFAPVRSRDSPGMNSRYRVIVGRNNNVEQRARVRAAFLSESKRHYIQILRLYLPAVTRNLLAVGFSLESLHFPIVVYIHNK